MNRLFIIVGFALVILSTVVGGTSQVQKSQGPGAEQEIRTLLREWDEAFKQRDTARIDRVLASDFVLTDAGGAVLQRSEYLMSVVKSPEFSRIESYLSEDVAVKVAGEKATVTGRSKVKGRPRGRGQAFGGDFRFTDTWVKRNGRWQVAASQSLRVESPAVRRPGAV